LSQQPPSYDHPEVSRSYFFPRREAPLDRRGDAGPVELRLPSGERLGAYWSAPLAAAPVLLYLHGNGETVRDQVERWPRWARDAGANLLLLDYPGYGTSEGEPCLTSCRQAARAALAHLLRRPAKQVPAVMILGRSVGSIFALDAAAATASRRLRGLMLESGIADLTQRLADRVPYASVGLDREEVLRQVARDFDHRRKLRRLRCPVLVMHTRADAVVPAWHAERLAAWAEAKLQRLVLFDAGDHNTIQIANEAAYRRHLADLVRAASVSSAPRPG
jgi:pimeloyl-ACP methyl ester carboxylesterase